MGREGWREGGREGGRQREGDGRREMEGGWGGREVAGRVQRKEGRERDGYTTKIAVQYCTCIREMDQLYVPRTAAEMVSDRVVISVASVICQISDHIRRKYMQ